MDKICMISLPTCGTGMKIFIFKCFFDLVEQRLRDKQAPTNLTKFHPHVPDFLFFDNLEQSFQAVFMPQFRRIFGAGIDTRPAADALVVGITEDSKFSDIVRFQGPGRAADLTGGTPGASALIETGSAKEEGDKNEHGFTA